MKKRIKDSFLGILFLALASCGIKTIKSQDTSHLEASTERPEQTAVKLSSKTFPNFKPEKDPNVEVLVSQTCKDVTNRTPVASAQVFSKDVGKVYFFSQIQRHIEEPSYILHVWHHEDSPVAKVKLPVEAFHWRTYSAKTISQNLQGRWHVDVVSASGKVIARKYFLID